MPLANNSKNELPSKFGFQTACVSNHEHSFVVFAERFIQLHGGSKRLSLFFLCATHHGAEARPCCGQQLAASAAALGRPPAQRACWRAWREASLGDVAKAAYAEFGLQVLPDWPKYSPDLNPQENVWSWVEEHLRRAEERSDSFETFCRKMLLVARQYPGGAALIPSMAERTEKVLGLKGGMSRY